jgi:hypothetical protein
MPPAPPKTPPSLIIGSVALWIGILSDSYLHNRALSIGFLLVASVFMILGIRALRKKAASSPAIPRPPGRRLALLLLAVLLGSVIGYFLAVHDHPEFSISTRVVIALASLLITGGAIVGAIYFRREKPNQ